MIKCKIQLNGHPCPHCNYRFGRRSELNRHLKHKICKKIKENELIEKVTADLYSKLVNNEIIVPPNADLEKQIQILKNEVDQLKDKPTINNQNILQVVCVGQKDNYLDMLTQQYGDFNRALEFIKDCALSNLTGDCKLIEKIYLNQGPQLNLYFVDKNRTKIEYYNENKELVRDTKELFGRKLANNLQNSYLKGVNHLINENLENKRCPNKFLEDYDLQMWNQHIFDLSEIHYQKKLVSRLNIPLKTN